MRDLKLTMNNHQLICIKENAYTCKNHFAFVHKPIKENNVTLVEWTNSCREVVCDRIRTAFNNRKEFDIKKLRLVVYSKFLSHDDFKELSKIQKKRIRLLKEKYIKEISVSIKVINLIEKKFKWPLTKVYHAECKKINENNIFYYFEGSKKWVKSPNLFSLFMLLVRVGSSLKNNTKFRTLDGFYRSLYKNKLTTDVSYLKTHYKRFLLAIEYYNRLFGKTSMRDLYLPNTSLNQFTEGVNNLCDLNTNNLDLRRKFAIIINENKMLEHWEKDKLIKKGEKNV